MDRHEFTNAHQTVVQQFEKIVYPIYAIIIYILVEMVLSCIPWLVLNGSIFCFPEISISGDLISAASWNI